MTCGTCLYAYDQAEHAPKLLSCSHTICQSCLELIASSPTLNNTAEAGCIKCPICRQNIAIPSGGISALPPSFLVNQLFDLVNKKPREFIPKCSIHIEQELLFCETCDCVFCDTCNNSNNNESDDSSLTTTTSSSLTNTNFSLSSRSQQQQQQQHLQNNKQHINETCTVIPFSTAIKRMSEILNYRNQQCLSKLDEARDNVQREVDKLESNCSDALRDIEEAFENIRKIIEDREKALLEETKKLHEYKKDVLLEQLKTIENEKLSLNTNSSVKINNETDVKNLSKKISDLTEKNDIALGLYTPRENCFICFENENNEAMENIRESVNCYGKIRTSKTYPPYCTSSLVHHSTHLRSVALVQSVDYEGCHQRFGGDPIQAELRLVGYNDNIDGEIVIQDKRDGTYEVSFIPPVPGKYQLFIYIFNRPIKNCPLTFETNSHHNPVAIFGQSSKRGVADQFDHFSQPASLIINKHNGRVYIMDSFNSRIKVLAQINSQECPFSFMQHIQSEQFTRSCTGIALLYLEDDEECDEHAIQTLSLSPSKPPSPNILVTDWRNHSIYELNSDGTKLLRQYTHEDLIEPTNIVVDSRGWIFVVDRETIFVFNSVGKLLHKLTGYKYGPLTRQGDSDSSSIKKVDPFSSEPQKLLANNISNNNQQQRQATANLLSTVQRDETTTANNKENNSKLLSGSNNNNTTATLNSFLINEKRANGKTNTLSSLISMRRKPKLNPSSSLQRGSKAVMSAASRIRSTFTLSHSTSLVSAASLQSMFNTNKQQLNAANQNHNHHHHQQSDNQTAVNLFDERSNLSAKQQRRQQQEKNDTSSLLNNSNATLPLLPAPTTNERQEDEMTLMSDKLGGDYDDGQTIQEDPIEPFGVLRGIAIGPDDELIVADETRVRVLQLADSCEFLFKRELFVHSRPGNHHHHHHHSNMTTTGITGITGTTTGTTTTTTTIANNHGPSTPYNGRLCSMTYDAQSRQLLALYTSSTNSGVPYIQVVDYSSGKTKFIIDSHDSRLIRPSCLATYGQHVIVTDLGNDCIKKYRFY